MATETLEQWAIGFIDYLAKFGGAAAVGANDPRVKFLVAMAEHEGTFSTTNPNNPLDIVMNEGVPSKNLSGNTSGVKTFDDVQDGYKALHLYLVNQGITGLLGQLMRANTTVENLGAALAAAHWEGSATPQAVQASQQYAARITQAAGGNLPNETTTTTMGSPTGTEQPMGSGGAPPAYETQGMNQQYTGPGAYKGFDLQGIPSQELNQAKRAIDAFTSQPGLESKMLRDIFSEFPQDSWMASIPEVRTLLLVATYNKWPVNQFQGALENTNWWKTTSDNLRLWEQTVATDPGQAQQAIAEAQARVTDIANSLGVQLNSTQLQAIARTVASQSVSAQGVYSATQFSDQQIYQMVTSTIGQAPGASVEGTIAAPGAASAGGGVSTTPEGIAGAQAALQSDQAQLESANDALAKATTAYRKHKDAETEAAVKAAQQNVLNAHSKVQQAQQLVATLGSASTSPAGTGSSQPGAPGATGGGTPGAPGTGGPATGTSGGDTEALYNAFQTIARNYYLSLTPQQIQNYVNQALKGDTGQPNFQSGAIAGFTQQAQNMAKSLYPALASILGTTSTTGTDNTPYAALAGYRSLIAQYTGYGGDPDTIDMTSPQWSWILSGKAPPGSQGANAQGGQGNSANATPTLPSYDQVQQYLMSTPQFQSTDLAKQLGWHVATAITRSFGFN